MKNMTNVKLRTFLTILIGINMIFQPFSIYFYATSQMSALSIAQSAVGGFCITFIIAYLLNEQLFKLIFYHMLKGKRIQNDKHNVFIITYLILMFVNFVLWFLSSLLTEYNYSSTIMIWMFLPIINMNQIYLISNGYFICGLRIIPLISIEWFKTTNVKRTGTLTIKYQGNRSFTTTNTHKCIDELSHYLETHHINQR